MCRGANEALGAASVEEAATDDSHSHRARAPAYAHKPTYYAARHPEHGALLDG